MTQRDNGDESEKKKAKSDDEPVVLRLVEYEITEEPIEDQESWLPEEVREEGAKLMEGVKRGSKRAVKRMEELVERYPDRPVLKNWLYVGYSNVGQRERAEALLERSYREHPEYLFAMCNYVNLLLSKGEVEKAGEVLGENYDLTQFYPQRRKFHITEFTSFATAVGQYLAQSGKSEQAMVYLDMMEQVAPDHPGTETLELLLMPEILKEAVEQLARGRARRTTKKKGGKGGPRKRKKD